MAQRTIKGVLLTCAIVVMAGCSRLAIPHDVRRGAMAVDGNLYASHFDGGELNAGGRAKIDALPAQGPGVLVIHVTRATDRQVFVRRARDVRTYARQRGLADAQVRFDSTYRDDEEFEPFDPMSTTTACVADDNR